MKRPSTCRVHCFSVSQSPCIYTLFINLARGLSDLFAEMLGQISCQSRGRGSHAKNPRLRSPAPPPPASHRSCVCSINPDNTTCFPEVIHSYSHADADSKESDNTTTMRPLPANVGFYINTSPLLASISYSCMLMSSSRVLSVYVLVLFPKH